MNIAIIPARGGSKRIPKKNIKDFYGKPIIAYSIEAALKSRLFDKVIVSTDDQEVAQIAKQCGADVPFLRPQNISDDYSSSDDAVSHAIDFLQNKNSNINFVCALYATAPLVKVESIIEGYKKIQTNKYDFVFSATEYSFPIQRAFKINLLGTLEMFQPDCYITRSQDLEKAYHDAGQFYWGKAHSFLEKKIVFSNTSTIVNLPNNEVIDIDTIEDWHKAEILYELLNN